MALYNVLNDEVGEDRASLPADCVFRTETLANLESDAPVAEWSRGFLRGHQWLEESWEACVPGDLEDEFSATLMTLSFFASKELAEAFVEETRLDVKAMAESIRREFPDAVFFYARLGRSIQKVLMEDEEIRTEPRRTVNIGRNDRCLCGSGKKYKKCCGARN